MLFRKRDSAATGAAASTVAVNADHIREQLAALEDEERYNETHFRHVIRYNLTSPLFWVLMIASMCFAVLNAHHGWVTSGGEIMATVALTIAMLYFVIELTIPVSAHLMTWSAPGYVRYLVRFLGVVSFSLGVAFSLTILQSNFTTGAETAATRAENNSDLLKGDRDSFKSLSAEIVELRAKSGGRTESSIADDMKVLLAQTVRKGGDTVGEASNNCTGERNNKVVRETCAEFDRLSRQKSAAHDLAEKQAQLDNVRSRIGGASEEGVAKNAKASDSVLAGMFGVNVDTLTSVKPTVIALVAAFLTHLLWAAHGASVNVAIARHRESALKRASLKRALDFASQHHEEHIKRVTQEFLTKRGGVNERAAAAIAGAQLADQPIHLQVTQFLNERTVMGPDFAQSVGVIHDHYSRWCGSNNVDRAPIDKFVSVLKTIGVDVASDGRVIGAAVKS